MEKNEVYHTWDNWCLLKLKELGRATSQEWAKAMGYKITGSMANIIKRNKDKLIITNRFYEVREDVDFKT